MRYDGKLAGGSLVCSSCGYDNPREHRYCGMCGTPFPHRPLTVPAAQSTLSFSSTPIEVASPPVAFQTTEAPPTSPTAAAPRLESAPSAPPEIESSMAPPASMEAAATEEVSHTVAPEPEVVASAGDAATAVEPTEVSEAVHTFPVIP